MIIMKYKHFKQALLFKVGSEHNTQWWQGVFIISKNMDSTFVSEISFGGLYSDVKACVFN